MSDQYVGEIRIFPFNYAPVGWAQCQGQILPVSQYTALFSLIGTYYGGNGSSNFGLPNFQGAVAVNQGQGPGLSSYVLGQAGGTTNVTLLSAEMPLHNHPLTADDEVATAGDPTGAYYMKGHYKVGTGTPGAVAAFTTLAPNVTMSSSMVGLVGGNLPHNNMMPYLALNFCIALQGIFPPRS